MQKLFLFISFILVPFLPKGQETLTLTIPEAEEIFLTQNLTLLAEKYNIAKAEAMLLQAGLFENPTVSYEQIGYNSEDHRFFNTRTQFAVEIEQMISISGRISKQKEIEKLNVEIAKQEFQVVLRELKFMLRSSLIGAAYTQKAILVFDKEIDYLDRIVKVYAIQHEKRNVSLIEKSRLEALLFALKSEQLEYIAKLNEYQNQIRLLLNLKQNVTVLSQIGTPELNIILPELTHFQDDIKNNPSLEIASMQMEQGRVNLSLQKRLRTPDIALKGVYDKADGFVPNYVGVGVAVGLPVFNRNQGNIKSANAQIEQDKLNYQYVENEILAELSIKYSHLKLLHEFYLRSDKSLEKDFSSLIEGIGASFEKRNINMLEFIDYYETYKETFIKLYENENALLNGIEEINKLMGSDYIKLWTK